MNKKNIFLWSLYDFANSIPVIVFFLYFSQWLVIENGVPDIWFNLIFVGGTLLLLFTGPVFGSIADKLGIRIPFLRVLTLLMFVGLLSTSILAQFFQINPVIVVLAAISFMLANYFYQFSFIFYNSLLHDLAPSKIHGFISGLGQSANWLGQITGLLITLPLVTGAVYIMGNPGRAQAFLPSTAIFLVLSLPMLILFKEDLKARKIKIDIGSEYKLAIKSFQSLIHIPGIGRFLLGYFFFNDAMLTAVNNLPIYLERVFKVTDKQKSILFLAILVTSAIGAAVMGWISDKVGLKKTLVFIVFSWAVIFPILASIEDFKLFSVLSIVLGFLYGATWTVTRAVFSYLSPPERLNHAFSFYTMFERFSTLVGPLVWGGITLLLLPYGELRYRVAMTSMAIFVIIGLVIVKSIPEKSRSL